MRLSSLGLATLCAAMLISTAAQGAGQLVSVGGNTNDKPQSKLWYHDGSWWSVVKGPNGVAIHEKVSGTWQQGAFVDALLSTAGSADVKWNGTHLTVLVYSLAPRLFQYTYDSDLRTWNLRSGFPVLLPSPPGTETMVLEQDSTGRYWMVTESDGQILAYYTNNDASNWNPTPVVLQTFVAADDICSAIDLGDGRIGVFWSDQNRDEFGFRMHQDSAPPDQWQPVEQVLKGVGIADDHINLAVDADHRVYAITKDDSDRMRMHRRSAAASWETHLDINGEDGTRGIVMLSGEDAKVYILYTSWTDAPHTIKYLVADLETLQFEGATRFLANTSEMNDVTGTKQMLPAGVFEAMASSSAGALWANGWGQLWSENTVVPGVPASLQAAIRSEPMRVELQWAAPASGPPATYNIYRQDGWDDFSLVGSVAGSASQWTDQAPPEMSLTYRVTALAGIESSPSASVHLDNRPVDPPGPLAAPSVDQVANNTVTGELVLWFDEGAGQVTGDLGGHENTPRLGNSSDPDVQDPQWVEGVAGSALQFDGVDDYLYVADSPSLQMTGSFSIESWVKRHAVSNGTLINKGTSGDRNYRISITAAGQVEFRWEDGNGIVQEVISPALVMQEIWTHIACVYDQVAQENRIYVDGVQVAAGFATGTPASSNEQIHIGARLSGSLVEFLAASIDQLRLKNGVLYDSDFVPTTDPSHGSGAEGTDVLVRWLEPTTGGTAQSYDIHRSVESAAAEWIGSSTGLSFVDASPLEGALCYTVTARNAQNESGPVSGATCTQVLPPPPSPPLEMLAFLQLGDPETVLLQWQAPTQNEPAVAYHVYRGVTSDPLERLTTTPVASSSFVDSFLVAGDLCWSVAGVDAQGREGAMSDPACLTWTPPAGQPPGPPQQLTLSLDLAPGPGYASGAVAFEMDAGNGQVLFDQTAHGLDAQLGSSPEADAEDPAWSTGISGSALQFDGINDRVVLPHDDTLDFTGSFTVEAWARRHASGERHSIVSKGDINQRNYWLQFTKSGYIEFGWETQSGANHGLMTQSPISDTNWHHIAGVYDQEAGYSRIFIDGIQVRSTADSGTPVSNQQPVYIGARLANGALEYFLEGDLDLVRLSNEALYSEDFAAPTQYATEDSVEAAVLRWMAPMQGTAVGYNVYRNVDGGADVRLNSQPLLETTFADIHMVSGNSCYEVTAVDVANQEGAAAASVCIQHDATPPPPPPAAPQNVSATWEAGPPAQVRIRWQEPPGPTVASYDIAHSFAAGAYTQVNTAPILALEWVQVSLQPGHHCWQVTAVDSLGQVGAASSEACFDVLPPPPDAPAAPILMLASSGDSVLVQWQAPGSTSVATYRVQRQDNGQAWSELAQTASLQWWDAALLPGQLCYRVLAADSLGQQSLPSESTCIDIEIALPPPPQAPVGLQTTLLQQAAPGSETGVAAYPFNEASGQDLQDHSAAAGGGWLGSLPGVDEADPLRAAGFEGNALVFDGLDDHATLADSPELDLAGSFTLEAWVQRLSSGERMAILSKGDSNNRNFWLQFTKSGYIEFRWEVSGGANHGLQTSSRIADQAWHHIAAVYDQEAGKSRIFVDGALWREVDDTGTPLTNDDVVLIGARRSGGALEYFYDGGIDQVRISAGALYDADFEPPTSMGSLRQVVSVDWQPVSGSVGYRVERAIDAGTFALLTPVAIGETSFVDEESPAGALCYRIVAVDAYGQTGSVSETSCAWITADPEALPLPPTNLTATLTSANADSVQLAWTSSGLHTHKIFRSIDGGAFDLLATVDSLTQAYLDAAAPVGALCYRLTANDSIGHEGIASDVACVDVLGPLPDPLAAPTNLQASWVELATGASGTAIYAMAEGEGQQALDSSGSGLHAQLGAQATSDAADPAWSAGIQGGALTFDGADDHLVVGPDAALNLTGSFTLEAWVQRASSGTRHAILGKGDTDTSNYWLRYTKSGYIEFRWESTDGADHGTQSGSPVTDGAWHHIAAVYDQMAGESRLYLDGVEIQVAADSGTPVTNNDPLIIGARYSLGSMTNFFDGSIDAVRISGEAVYDADFVPPTTYGGGGTMTAVDLSWEAPAGTVAGYRVYRQDDGGAWLAQQSEPLTELLYRDAAVSGDACYRVVAVDAFDREGAASEDACSGPAPAKATWAAAVPWHGPELTSMPNPFNPRTTIRFRLPDVRTVRIEIFDVRGRRVRQLLGEERQAGEQSVVWHGRDDQGVRVSSGTYFALLHAGEIRERIKLVVLK